MANKLILVPEPIYRGLTTSSTGKNDLNLDFAQQTLEGAKRKKQNISAKNINYNQALRRYLHLRNERENKPLKVELADGPRLLARRQRPGAVPNIFFDEDEDLDFEVNVPDDRRRYYNIAGVEPTEDGSIWWDAQAVPSSIRTNQIEVDDFPPAIAGAMDAPLPSPSRVTPRKLVKRKGEFDDEFYNKKRKIGREENGAKTAKQKRIDVEKRRSLAAIAARQRRENQPAEVIDERPTVLVEALDARLPSPERVDPRKLVKRKGEYEEEYNKKRRIGKQEKEAKTVNQRKREVEKRRSMAAIAARQRRDDQPAQIIDNPIQEALEAHLPSPERSPSPDIIPSSVVKKGGKDYNKKLKIKGKLGKVKRAKLETQRRRRIAVSAERQQLPDDLTGDEASETIDDALAAPLASPSRVPARQIEKRKLGNKDYNKNKKLKIDESAPASLHSVDDVLIDRLYRTLNINPQKYKVRGNTILSRRGEPIAGSNLRESLQFMLRYQKGTAKRTRTGTIKPPPGTSYIRNRIANNPIFRPFFTPKPKLKFSKILTRQERQTDQSLLKGTKRAKFTPSLW